MAKNTLLFVFLVSCFFSFNAQAAWEDDFKRLKDVQRSFEDTGAICEELARLRFEDLYPNSNYKVVVGISYGDLKSTIGELDVVVIDEANKKAVQVAEVKCWKSFAGGLEKAKEQRQRFLNALKSKHTLYYQCDATEESYEESIFSNVSTFLTVGPKGSKQAGYDFELEYDFKQLRHLGMELLRCQDRGECAKP